MALEWIHDQTLRSPAGRRRAGQLFDLPPNDDPAPTTPVVVERPRLCRAVRDQVVYRALALDSLLPPDHDARIIWAYVEGLDPATLHEAISSVAAPAGPPRTLRSS